MTEKLLIYCRELINYIEESRIYLTSSVYNLKNLNIERAKLDINEALRVLDDQIVDQIKNTESLLRDNYSPGIIVNLTNIKSLLDKINVKTLEIDTINLNHNEVSTLNNLMEKLSDDARLLENNIIDESHKNKIIADENTCVII